MLKNNYFKGDDIMPKIIKCGIINANEIIEMEDDKLIPYLHELLNNLAEFQEYFEVYKTTTFVF